MQSGQLKRREFIAVVGGAAVAWPFSVRAQQLDRMRHIGMLAGFDDPELKVFQQELERLGWSQGRNIRIDYRYAPAAAQVQTLAKELVALHPDVIFAQSRPATAALQRETRTIPIVFNFVIDPIGAGFITSLARPGGNITGFQVYEPSVAGKWIAMIKEIAPRTTHVALLGNPSTAPYYDYLLQGAAAAAPSLGVEVLPGRIKNDAADIERAIIAVASVPSRGIFILPDSTTSINHDLIITLVARNRVPAVWTGRFFAAAGGLISYGVVYADQYRQAASYVDRILRGAKPGDLPVQTPTKYETVLNLKTAKALGLTVPPGLLVAADEVIE
jgi:putative tryptophan/tyrosine transport system substrate-binding protein